MDPAAHTDHCLGFGHLGGGGYTRTSHNWPSGKGTKPEVIHGIVFNLLVYNPRRWRLGRLVLAKLKCITLKMNPLSFVSSEALISREFDSVEQEKTSRGIAPGLFVEMIISPSSLFHQR